MKDEYGGVDQFIGLKSKMYSMRKINGSESSTAKGEIQQQNLMNLKMLCLIKNY